MRDQQFMIRKCEEKESSFITDEKLVLDSIREHNKHKLKYEGKIYPYMKRFSFIPKSGCSQLVCPNPPEDPGKNPTQKTMKTTP